MADYENELIKRIDECRIVKDELGSSKAWSIILRDLDVQRETIDNNWHLIPKDDKRLDEFRVTKFAVMHLINLVEKYEQDMITATEELRKFQHPDEEIMKDYDTETGVNDG